MLTSTYLTQAMATRRDKSMNKNEARTPISKVGRFLSLVANVVLVLVVSLAFIGLAHAERHALLVGVSSYPALEAKLQLEGPKNDIPLIRSVLERRGFTSANTQVLADGVSGAIDPSRAAVLAALDQLVAKTRNGDFAFIYFAGHGSQMPADRSTPQGKREGDGLHEIFLPRDVGKWNDTVGAVQNAIVNHELVDRLDALTSKGVFVWAIFDACHSAMLMRSGGDPEIRYRQVEPSALGIPRAKLDAAEADAIKTRGGDQNSVQGAVETTERGKASGAGGFVAFYAAQTTETTPEMRLPAGHPNRKPYGLFGYTLAEALSTVDGVTYRQLGQHVLQRYAALGMNAPTPLFSGTNLDAPIFGSQGGSLIRQWPIETSKGLSIQAGILNQITDGSILAIMPGPLAKNEEALGYVRVERAEVLTSSLMPVEHKGRSALASSNLPVGAQARLVEPQVSFALRAIAPAKSSAAGNAQVLAAIEAIQKTKPAGVDLRFVSNAQEHDLRLHLEDGKLWMIPPSGQLYKDGPNKTASILIEQTAFNEKLIDNLQRIGKALNLMRISSQLSSAGGAATGTLEVSMSLLRKGAAPVALSASTAQPFLDEDTIEVTLKNKGRAAIDLTALYVDADYGISVLFPYQSGVNNRIEAGATHAFKIEIHDDTIGLERLVLVAVEARANSDRYDFSFMAQAKLERTRGGPEDEIASLFQAAGFGDDQAVVTRGGKAAIPSRTQMQVFPFKVSPKK
jgi:Caspase domain